MTGSASRPNRTEKEIRFAERKIRPDGFGSTSTRPGRNLTRTFPKTEPKFGLQNLPNIHIHRRFFLSSVDGPVKSLTAASEREHISDGAGRLRFLTAGEP